MKRIKYGTLTTVVVFVLSYSVACTSSTPEITPDEARAIAKEAYVYGFPMVMGYKLMYAYTVNEQSPEYKAPFNHMGCEARLYTPEDKAVVTPNADTPYCMQYLDVREEPVVLSVPEVEPERYNSVQLIDLYTHNFAYLGTLTTGNEAGQYLIAGPGWGGKKPDGIKEVIRSETNFIFSVVRIQLFGPDDLDSVKRLQDAYELQPLSAYLGEDVSAPAPVIDFPEWKEGAQFDSGFFAYFDFLLSLIQPVADEQELMGRLARIGLGTDEPFDLEGLAPEMRQALEEGVEEGFAEIEAFRASAAGDPLASAKIFGTREFLKKSAKENYALPDFYLIRAMAAHAGLYGNSGAEAIYPTYLTDAEGKPLNASENKYTITFKKGQLPPVKLFWSLSMYDGKTQLFIHNPLDRYLLNSTMMNQFVENADGSLTFYVQKDSPGKELESNWLPAPDGPFYTVMRLYGPEEAALKGEWINPPLVKEN